MVVSCNIFLTKSLLLVSISDEVLVLYRRKNSGWRTKKPKDPIPSRIVPCASAAVLS